MSRATNFPRDESTKLQKLYANYCTWCYERGFPPADFDTWRKTTAVISEFQYA
jgi:hypothetical protein